MYLYPTDPQDQQSFLAVRDELTVLRRARGITSKDLSATIGHGAAFVHALERSARDSPLVSSLQAWAAGLDCRIEFTLDDFWLHAHRDQEMLTHHMLSRAWGADEFMRLWLVSALRQWRVKQMIDVEELGLRIGISAGAVRDWEDQATDPVLKRVMLQARMAGTRLRLQLWHRDKWTFEV